MNQNYIQPIYTYYIKKNLRLFYFTQYKSLEVRSIKNIFINISSKIVKKLNIFIVSVNVSQTLYLYPV